MGKLVVIDGLDGSGKTTQTKILAEKLRQRNFKIKVIEHPNYNSEACSLVKMYLNGEISRNLFDINCFAASSFFACDHYVNYIKNWKKEYDLGDLILANRYVSSNAIHQMSKLSEIDWEDFLKWLIDFEFNRLGLPQYNELIYLDLPPEISRKLIAKRNVRLNKKSDIHEENLNYLIRCRKAAFFCAKKFNWTVVNCFYKNESLSIVDIANKVDEVFTNFNI